MKYNYELLKTLCNTELLNNDYINEKLTRDTYIEGKCITENCQNNFYRRFRYLYERNNLCCDECSKNNAKLKAKNTFITNYGVENPMHLQETKNKVSNTLIIKYGVKHQMYLQETKDKIEKTCLSKYGEKHPLKSNDIKNKLKNTCLKKYGVENIFQTEEFNLKSKLTSLKKYNVEYPAQSNEFKEKSKKTFLKKYGVEYALQNKDIMDKVIKNSYKLKEYVMPSGKVVKCQGYEPYALRELINNNIIENDIITGIKNIPELWYIDSKSKKHRHYVDIFIHSQNKCVEVKSEWTFNKQPENVLKKQEYAKKLGYLYEIWVYNSKGAKINCII
jgi:hypothetical protein